MAWRLIFLFPPFSSLLHSFFLVMKAEYMRAYTKRAVVLYWIWAFLSMNLIPSLFVYSMPAMKAVVVVDRHGIRYLSPEWSDKKK
jgi:hypothetical protein